MVYSGIASTLAWRRLKGPLLLLLLLQTTENSLSQETMLSNMDLTFVAIDGEILRQGQEPRSGTNLKNDLGRKLSVRPH